MSKERNYIKMMDISPTGLNKDIVYREAKAKAIIKLSKETINKIKNNEIPKGNVLLTAKIAGIMAAKNTYNIIPLCHPINPDFIDIDILLKNEVIEVYSLIKGEAKTGFEMEALTAVSIASLTIYDFCKSIDNNIKIIEISLDYKKKSQKINK
jgi:cyclic pyranopterin phosphate synthase